MQAVVLMSKMGRFAAAASIFIPRTAHSYRKGNPSSVANTLLFHTQFSTNPNPNPNPPNVIATTKNPMHLQKKKILLEKYKEGVDDALGLFHQMARTHPLPSLVHHSHRWTDIAKSKEYYTFVSFFKVFYELATSTDKATSIVLMTFFRCVLKYLDGNQEFGEAVEVLRLMQDQGMGPDVEAYDIIISGMWKAGKIEDARKLFGTALAEGLKPNVKMYTDMVRGLCKADLLDEGEELLMQMEKDGCPDVVAYGIVINGMCKAGKIEDAHKLFGTALAEGLKPSVEMYTDMVRELCKVDLLDEAEELLVQMEKDGCPPDAVTYNIIVQAFLEKGVRHKVTILLQEMIERSFPPDARTMSKLVDWLIADGEDLK